MIEVHDSTCDHAEDGCKHDAQGCKLHLGRSRRRAGAALERAVRMRDEGLCQFPGCESRGYLHLHHVKHWARGGPTDLDNLTLLCSFHHRAVHEGGYKVTRQEDNLVFFTPAGFRILQQRSPMVLDDSPVETLVTEQDALEITAETGRAGWDGFFPVDYADAVGWLLELDG